MKRFRTLLSGILFGISGILNIVPELIEDIALRIYWIDNPPTDSPTYHYGPAVNPAEKGNIINEFIKTQMDNNET